MQMLLFIYTFSGVPGNVWIMDIINQLQFTEVKYVLPLRFNRKHVILLLYALHTVVILATPSFHDVDPDSCTEVDHVL